jgi:hypothetical protein
MRKSRTIPSGFVQCGSCAAPRHRKKMLRSMKKLLRSMGVAARQTRHFRI